MPNWKVPDLDEIDFELEQQFLLESEKEIDKKIYQDNVKNTNNDIKYFYFFEDKEDFLAFLIALLFSTLITMSLIIYSTKIIFGL